MTFHYLVKLINYRKLYLKKKSVMTNFIKYLYYMQLNFKVRLFKQDYKNIIERYYYCCNTNHIVYKMLGCFMSPSYYQHKIVVHSFNLFKFFFLFILFTYKIILDIYILNMITYFRRNFNNTDSICFNFKDGLLTVEEKKI